MQSLTPRNLRLYRDIARLLIRYGRSDLIRNAGLDDVVPPEEAEPASAPEAERLAEDLEQLGPTFVKLGQLLSTRSDLLPMTYLESLARLQDRVEPFSFAEVESIVQSELGLRLSKGFAEFDHEPIASASLGQVHAAALRDGRPVAVKVQRPGIRERISDDLDGLGEIAEVLDRHTDVGARYGFEQLFDEFRKSLIRELDYQLEARNLVTLAKNLEEYERILVPQPVDGYTTTRVLTMDLVRGRKITALGPLAKLELDGSQLADELFGAYLKQILIDGFFHADPHPGNVFITEDRRLALIDLGMVAYIAPRLQELLLQLLLAVAEGRADAAADFLARLGERTEQYDETRFTRAMVDLVQQQAGRELEDIQIGRVVLQLSSASARSGVRPPPELSMLGRALVSLDQIGRTLDPRFNPNAAIRRHGADLLRRRLLDSATPGNVYSGMLEVKDFVERFPDRVNRVLDLLSTNQVQIGVKAFDEQRLMKGLHRVANRIAVGVILAALIIGAALLMRVDTSFKLLGYPGLAIILFLLAAAGGVAMVIAVIRTDE